VRAGRVRFLLTHIPGHEAKDVVGGLTDPRSGHQRGPASRRTRRFAARRRPRGCRV